MFTEAGGTFLTGIASALTAATEAGSGLGCGVLAGAWAAATTGGAFGAPGLPIIDAETHAEQRRGGKNDRGGLEHPQAGEAFRRGLSALLQRPAEGLERFRRIGFDSCHFARIMRSRVEGPPRLRIAIRRQLRGRRRKPAGQFDKPNQFGQPLIHALLMALGAQVALEHIRVDVRPP